MNPRSLAQPVSRLAHFNRSSHIGPALSPICSRTNKPNRAPISDRGGMDQGCHRYGGAKVPGRGPQIRHPALQNHSNLLSNVESTATLQENHALSDELRQDCKRQDAGVRGTGLRGGVIITCRRRAMTLVHWKSDSVSVYDKYSDRHCSSPKLLQIFCSSKPSSMRAIRAISPTS